MSSSLSDQETEQQLRDSGLPRVYIPKERSLNEIRKWGDGAGSEYVDALFGHVFDDIRNSAQDERGVVVSLLSDTQEGIDTFYLTGRALTLQGVGVGYVDLPTAIVEGEGKVDPLTQRKFDRCQCIALSGMQSAHSFPFSDRYQVYWERVLTNLLAEGKSLLLQSDGPLLSVSSRNGWWSDSFIVRIGDATELLAAIK